MCVLERCVSKVDSYRAIGKHNTSQMPLPCHRRLLIVKRNERDARKNCMVCSHDYLTFDRRAASFASLSFPFYRFYVIVAIGIPYLCVATWTAIYNATHLVDDDDNYANAFAIRSDFRFSIVKHLKKLNSLLGARVIVFFYLNLFFLASNKITN